MKNIKRKFSSDFKLSVILDALTEKQTLTQLSQKYELHATQISQWKLEFLAKAKQINELKQGKPQQTDQYVNELFAKIGKLQMEIDFLKKKLL